MAYSDDKPEREEDERADFSYDPLSNMGVSEPGDNDSQSEVVEPNEEDNQALRSEGGNPEREESDPGRLSDEITVDRQLVKRLAGRVKSLKQDVEKLEKENQRLRVQVAKYAKRMMRG